MRLSVKTKAGYAVAGIGDAASYTFIGTYLLFFLTTVVGMDPVMAGTVSAIGAFWDTLWSPVMGFISDRSYTRWGRRIPFIFVAAFPLAAANCFLFMTVDAGETFRFVYYTAMVIIFWTAFCAFFNPYLALGAEVTDDYHERTSLRGFTSIMNMVGMMVGMVLPTVIVDALCNVGASIGCAWQTTGAIIGLISFVSLMVTVFTLKTKEKGFKAAPRKKGKRYLITGIKMMIKEYKEIIMLKPLQKLIFVALVFLCANTIIASDRIYFLTYNLEFSPMQITIVLSATMLTSMAITPAVIRLSRRSDKRSTFIGLMFFSSLCVFAAKFFGIDSMAEMLVLVFVFAWGNTVYWQLMPSMIYDVCEVDELYSGKRREGAISSLLSLSEAFSGAVSMQVMGFILGYVGFDGEAATQGESALSWIESLLTSVPGALMAVSAFLMLLYPVTKEKFDEIMKALEKRRSGVKLDRSDYPIKK